MDQDYGDNLIKCPLLDKGIYEAHCMDINLVRTKAAKPSILEDSIDMPAADRICKDCKHRPI